MIILRRRRNTRRVQPGGKVCRGKNDRMRRRGWRRRRNRRVIAIVTIMSGIVEERVLPEEVRVHHAFRVLAKVTHVGN